MIILSGCSALSPPLFSLITLFVKYFKSVLCPMSTPHCRIHSKSRCCIITAYVQAPINVFSPGLAACVIAASILPILTSQFNKTHRLAASLLSPVAIIESLA